MDRFIPNVPGCSKYHISKDGVESYIPYLVVPGKW